MTDERKKAFIDFCVRDNFDISDDSNPQKRAVFDNVNIVPAGAGSGKTAVLSHRFLRLVMDGIHSDEILTITFTRAATANMKSKIYRLLRKACEEGLIAYDEIERFAASQIVTTDSLCSSIARLGCVKYGISQGFSIETEDSEKRVSDRIIMSVLLSLEPGSTLENILEFRSLKQIKETFLEIGRKYTDICNDGSSSIDYAVEIITSDLRRKSEEARAVFLGLCSEYKYKYDEARCSSKGAGKTFTENYIILEKITDLVLNCTVTPKDLRSSALSGQARKGEKAINEAMNNYALYLECLSEESLINLHFCLTVINEYKKQLILHKRQTGLLSFRDVMKMSLDILKNDADIRNRFRKKYKSIMVDEFQDNNDDNRILVYLIAASDSYEGGRNPDINDIEMDKVFMVGDQKQSIYRFRGADVSVFKTMSKDFGAGRTAVLDVNYRSKPAIVKTVNGIFSTVFAPEGEKESLEDYEAQFSAQIPFSSDFQNSGVRFMFLKSERGGNNRDSSMLSDAQSEAYYVASRIKDIVCDNPDYYIKSDGKRIGYSDVAILLRKSSNQGLYEKAMQHFGIPFQVSESKSLLSEAPANDFFSIMHLAVYGFDDKLILMTYLKSPFCCLSEAELDIVSHADICDGIPVSDSLSAESAKRYIDCIDYVKRLKDVMARGCIANAIRFIWEDLGYRFFILKNPDNRPYEEHYEYLFSLACDYDRQNLTAVDFLEFLRQRIGSGDGVKDLTILREKADAVNLMTIHKSKGLEFPVVFVSDLASGASQGGFRCNVSQTMGYTIIPFAVSCDTLVNPYTEKDVLMENAETKRILYVAATRAVNYLFFTGVIKGKNPQNTDSRSLLSPVSLLLRGLGYDSKTFNNNCGVETEEFFLFGKSCMESVKSCVEPVSSDCVSAWYNNAYEPVCFDDNRTSVTMMSTQYCADSDECGFELLPSVECDELLSWNDSYAALFGTYVHKLLELEFLGIDSSSFYGDFKYHEKREVIRSSAVGLKDAFLNSPFFKGLSSYRFESEKRFCFSDGEKIVSGSIDLLCVSESEKNIVIVDYKTDRFRNDKYHMQQLSLYAESVKSIYPDAEISVYLFYLRGALPVKLM